MSANENNGETSITGAAAGVLYGVLTNAIFAMRENGLPLQFLAFLIGLPIGMGGVSLLFADERQMRCYRRTLFMPIVSVLGLLVALLALGWEGPLCLVMLATPLVIVTALVVWVVRALRLRHHRRLERAAGLS